jgi:hypothetical protein
MERWPAKVLLVLALLADTSCSSDDDGAGDGGGDSDGSPVVCPGGWSDPSTGLCWHQDPRALGYPSWSEAGTRCSDLSEGGVHAGFWRFPTIGELRSLVRGCPETETGGACAVTDTCMESTCGAGAECSHCTAPSPPGEGGCYWPEGLQGPCDYPYWAESLVPASDPQDAWRVDFEDGEIYAGYVGGGFRVRCVHGGR